MELKIKKAERKAKKFKGAISGVSGSGKTYTALQIAKGLAGEGKILLADTENESSTLYADYFDFDVVNIENYSTDTFLKVMSVAAENGYEVLVIDSLSHAWEELLEEKERVQKRDKGVNSFTAWAQITPIYRKLVAGVVRAPIHIIATMRAKSEHIIEQVEKNGRTVSVPRKVGMAPIFRSGGEYEFDVVANIDLDHDFVVEKSRLFFLSDQVINKPTEEVGEQIKEFLGSGKTNQYGNHKVISRVPNAQGQTLQGLYIRFTEKALLKLYTRADLIEEDAIAIRNFLEEEDIPVPELQNNKEEAFVPDTSISATDDVTQHKVQGGVVLGKKEVRDFTLKAIFEGYEKAQGYEAGIAALVKISENPASTQADKEAITHYLTELEMAAEEEGQPFEPESDNAAAEEAAA